MLSTIDLSGYIYSKGMKYLNYKLYIKNLKILLFKFIELLISIIKYTLLKNISFFIKTIGRFFSRNLKSAIKYKLSFYPIFFNRLKLIYFIINNDKYKKTLLEDLVHFLMKYIIAPTFRKFILKEKFKNFFLKDLDNILKTSNFIDPLTQSKVNLLGIDDISTPLMSMEEESLSEEEQEVYKDLVKNIKIIEHKG